MGVYYEYSERCKSESKTQGLNIKSEFTFAINTGDGVNNEKDTDFPDNHFHYVIQLSFICSQQVLSIFTSKWFNRISK